MSSYAGTSELAALLRVNGQGTQLQRVLDAATEEIDAECGTTFGTAPPALVQEVCIERAVEHWKQMQSPFGLVGLAGEGTPAFASADSWNRHAQKLAPLKVTWGIG